MTKLHKIQPFSKSNSAQVHSNGKLVEQKSKKSSIDPVKRENLRTNFYQIRNVNKVHLTPTQLEEKRTGTKKFFAHQHCGCATGKETIKTGLNKNQKFGFKGIISCGYVWHCPVCSFKVMSKRAEEINTIKERHLKKNLKVGFITLTVRHSKVTPLKNSIQNLLSNYRKFQQHKAQRNLRKSGILTGQIKTLEFTWSTQNGWHPHLHLLYFYDISDANNIDSFQKDIIKDWTNYTGGSVIAQDQKTINKDQKIGDYFNIGMEMTKSFKEGKESINPFQILENMKNQSLYPGQTSHLESFKKWSTLWSEYKEATKGKHRVHISESLRLRYDLEYQSDEELLNSEQEKIEQTIIEFTRPLWKVIMQNTLEPHIIDLCERNRDNPKNQRKQIISMLREIAPIETTKTNDGEMILHLGEFNQY